VLLSLSPMLPSVQQPSVSFHAIPYMVTVYIATLPTPHPFSLPLVCPPYPSHTALQLQLCYMYV
jgi:hypothetical protein